MEKSEKEIHSLSNDVFQNVFYFNLPPSVVKIKITDDRKKITEYIYLQGQCQKHHSVSPQQL